ncbi:MAG TPA: hypothetical protein VFG62_11395 [Rhodopila sp.]|jgi:hypothetical protein|nr:hypothetical protein [Rhodopila sp.]
MPLADLPEALFQTIIHQLAFLLLQGAGGNMEAARQAAAITLGAHMPQTEVELRLAARIVAFNLQAGEALAQAANPEMPLTRVLRLRTGAVSLAREAEKAERRLEKLREARLRGLPEEPESFPESESPRVEKTTALIEDNRKVAAYAEAHGLSWGEAHRQRNREKRLAERRAKEAARAGAAPAFA